MIVQACLNGSRRSDYHDQLPLTAGALARDGAACVAADAAELHIHPRALNGVESLAARQWSTRVGLEDGKHLADGTIAPSNAVLVAAAVAISPK